MSTTAGCKEWSNPEGWQTLIDYLNLKGYKVAVYDVYCNEPTYLFETWFVKDDIDFDSMSFEDWKRSMEMQS
jgi:hypothetical protein